MIYENFYRGKKVLITGHTGFKGTWMCQVLLEKGADVTGYALQPPTTPSLFELLGMKQNICSMEGDVRDLEHLRQVFEQTKSEIVIHMAAQPIVRESYKNSVFAYLLIAQKQYVDENFAGNYNIGPDESSCLTTGALVTEFCKQWKDIVDGNVGWKQESDKEPHEANCLKLDCSKMKAMFGWKPVWDPEEMLRHTVEWMGAYAKRENVLNIMKEQISAYAAGALV